MDTNQITKSTLKEALRCFYAEHQRYPREGEGDATKYGVPLTWDTIDLILNGRDSQINRI